MSRIERSGRLSSITIFKEVHRGRQLPPRPSFAIDREDSLRRLIELGAFDQQPRHQEQSGPQPGSLNSQEQLIVAELHCRGGCALIEELGSGVMARRAKRQPDLKSLEAQLGHMEKVGVCARETLPGGSCTYRLTEEAKRIIDKFLPQINGATRLH